MNDDIKEKNWMQSRWRPAMGFTYMVICIFDFIIAPILWSGVQALQAGNVTLQWNPLTLIAGGFFHIAMGAICGVAAWTRGSEKVATIQSPDAGNQQTVLTPETVSTAHGYPGYAQQGYPSNAAPNYNQNLNQGQPLDKY